MAESQKLPHNNRIITEEHRLRTRRLYEKRLHERKLRIYEEALDEALKREKLSTIRNIFFCIKYETSFGQDLTVVGNIPELGNWDIKQGVKMIWSPGNLWTIKVEIFSKIENIEYKYVISENYGSHKWEPGQNHKVQINMEKKSTNLRDAWGGGGL
ncbi:starch binding domain-containing protein [Cryptosporidium muris RN66]|uniref:Starch binding domain-containing protein n=1 Tax=Cryptosporidium muris (strain RN66) TaxID=441375 RepID=B6AJ10_CRYMR|nr:starch binding domain-containing protein [Cryptosporidium muris RN66]EEA08201.1 starch binding domain-containing protein [Cryptosporidium muris RN66]|eukprot:XP_002142550.1 starch binding domain-containing protein [Cryptosporidium muris RN66]